MSFPAAGGGPEVTLAGTVLLPPRGTQIIAAAVLVGGSGPPATVRGPVTTRRVPDLTHILRRDPAAPSIRAYRALVKLPVDAVVLKDISTWIDSVARQPKTLEHSTDG